MNVKLIASTKSEISDDMRKAIAYIARVSSSRKDKTNEGERLIEHLIKNNHWSPFEHSYYTFEIETTRAIARQLLRHRSATFQEFSQRYATVKGIEMPELRMKGGSNRQGSTAEVLKNEAYIERVRKHLQDSLELYQDLISLGVANESARNILPECTDTTIIMTNNIRNWIHFLSLRLDKHAQKEIREIAMKIFDLLDSEFSGMLNIADIDATS